MAFQGIFKRGKKYIAVKNIQLSTNDTLEAGTIIPKTIRVFQLRLWFRRHKIGIAGSPWAEQMLAGIRCPEAQIVQDIKNGTVEDNPELTGLETKEGADVLDATVTTVVDDIVASTAVGEGTASPTAEEIQAEVDADAETARIQAEVEAEQADIDAKFAEDARLKAEQDGIDEAKVKADKEQKEADEAKDALQAKKDARNKREREKRAAKKLAENK